MHCVYGISGAMAHRSDMTDNENLLLRVLSIAKATQVPTIVMGDFNVDPMKSALLQEVHHQGAWIDVGRAFAEAQGVDPAPTFYGHRLSTSRIDVVLANPAAMQLVTGYALHPTIRFSDHCPIVVTLEPPKLNINQLRFHKVRAIDLEDVTQAQRDCVMREVEDKYLGQLAHSIAEADADAAYEVFCQASEEYLLTLLAETKCDSACLKDAKCRGRGTQKEPETTLMHSTRLKDQCPSESQDMKTKRKAARLVEEILHKAAQGLDDEVANLRDKLGRILWAISVEDTRDLRGLRKRLLEDVTKEERHRRRRRVHQWRRKMAEVSQQGGSGLFQKFGGTQETQASVITLSDGTVTGRVDLMDEELRACWCPIMAKHDYGVPKPSTQEFVDKYADFIPHAHYEDQDLTHDMVRQAVQDLKTNAAPGTDGWSPKEMKLLHDDLLQWLTWVFLLIEETGQWPQTLTRCVISLISKGKGSRPLDLRPVSVTSVVYRIWAKTFGMRVEAWQDAVLDSGQYGCRKKRSSIDALWEITTRAEYAHRHERKSRVLMAVDLAKAFDNIPVDIAMEIARRAGLPAHVLRPLIAVYEQMVKHFKVGTGVGLPWRATNGVMQGCPASCIPMNLVLAVVTRAIRMQVPQVDMVSYVDDVTLLGKTEDVQKALDIFNVFLGTTGQELSLTKTATSYSDLGQDLVKLGNHRFEHTPLLKILGVHVGYVEGDFRVELQQKKVGAAVEACRRITTSELGYNAREKVLSLAVVPRVLYGCEVADLAPAQENGLRAAVTTAQWMKPGRRRSTGLIMTLLARGYLMDPTQVLLVRRLIALRRACQREDIGQMVRTMLASDLRGARGGGPVSTLIATQKRYNYQLTEFIDMEQAALPHAARDLARRAVWRQVAEQRRGFADTLGINHGIDRDRTLQLMKSNELTETMKGALRFIISGAFWQPQGQCPHCEAEAGVRHALWYCPRFAEIRLFYGMNNVNVDSLPVITQCLGIYLIDYNLDMDHILLQKGMLHIFRAILHDNGVQLNV